MSTPEPGFGPLSATRSAGRPTVVELVGVAATGKTSLLRALGRSDPTLQAGLRPPAIRHLAQILPLLPTFLALHWPYRGLLRKEMKRITYLRTVFGMLHGELPGRPHAVILDEGPVYMLARLRVYGADRIRTAAFERWWRGAVAQWARTVDLIVWLDAPDTILLQRSRTRAQVHQLQRLSDVRAQQFLAAYRQAYEAVVSALAELSGPAVLRVSSDHQGVEAIRDQVLSELRLITARRSG